MADSDLLEVVRLLPDVLFRCHKEADGKIYWSLNEGGLAEEFGVTTDAIQGKSLEELFPGGASDELKEHFEAAFRGEPTVFTNEMGGRHFRHFPRPVRDAKGNVVEVVGFIADVTELVQAQRDLQGLVDDLTAFNRSVTHDLGNPLAALRMDAATLVGMVDGGQAAPTAERMRRTVDRMSGLVSSLLRLSKASQVELVRDAVDVTAAAHEIAEELDRAHPDRNVEWDLAPGLTARADPALCHDVLQNLMQNAHKFTHERHVARIAVRSDPDRPGGRFVVEDNGCGFHPDEQARLFEPFHRGDTRVHGHGIGLATVRRIMERHGGTIEAHGRPGEGAAFHVDFGP